MTASSRASSAGGLVGYPALVDGGTTVSLRVLATEPEQRAAHHAGVRRLLLLGVPSPLKWVSARLDNRAKLELSRANPYRSIADLLDDCAGAAIDRLVAEAGGPAWDSVAFAALRESVRADLVDGTANVVTQVRTPEKDGYNAIQVGFGEIDGRKVNKPRAGHFTQAGTTPRRHLVEIRTNGAGEFTVGQELPVDTFTAGEAIDVTGTSKGKGFAGVMKRHGFHGVSSSHGAHRNHRKPGSIGACATPGRVFKGMRMSGRMGSDTVTTQNLTVHAVDADKGLILVKGAIPGPKGGLVVLRYAAKAAPTTGSEA